VSYGILSVPILSCLTTDHLFWRSLCVAVTTREQLVSRSIIDLVVHQHQEADVDMLGHGLGQNTSLTGTDEAAGIADSRLAGYDYTALVNLHYKLVREGSNLK